MSAALITTVLLAVQAGSFRIGFTYDGSWPAMGDEKDYSDLMNEAGIDYNLDGMAWTGGVEALGDVSTKLRLRGAVTVSRYHGVYDEDYDPFGYIITGLITGGLLFLFGSGDEDIVALEDASTNIEAAAYYKLNDSFSLGGGPVYSMVSRSLETPNTSNSESASGLGFMAGVRIDGNSGVFGLPIVFGAEGGYRYNSVTFDTEYSDDFAVDFSGPYLKVGTYLRI